MLQNVEKASLTMNAILGVIKMLRMQVHSQSAFVHAGQVNNTNITCYLLYIISSKYRDGTKLISDYFSYLAKIVFRAHS